MTFSIKCKINICKGELKLIKLLASGNTLKEIAKKTEKTYNNIHKQTQYLYNKFNVHDRRALIQSAISQQIISTSDIKNKFKKRFTKHTEYITNYDRTEKRL